MTSPTNKNQLRRAVLTSFIGTTIEWYDFYIYGLAAALVLNQLFFPTLEPWAGTMAAFATYAVGFFARPVGGIVFGHFGDRIGRKSMLVVTLVLMGLATFAIGLLPTYDQIGIMAPVLLVALRFAQGFGVGGEWGGAVLMAVEHGKDGKRGFYGSWAQAGVPMGMILATGVFTLCEQMPRETLFSWGWRIPFLAGIALTSVGLLIRLNVHESPVFEAANQQPNNAVATPPLLHVVKTYRRNVLLAIGMRFGENISFYVLSVFLLSYAIEIIKLPKQMVLNGILLANAVAIFTIPFFAWLSDRWGRRPIYMAGAILMMICAFIPFEAVNSSNPWLIALALVFTLSIAHAAMYGPQAAFLSELFGTQVRYSGASLGYQMASPLAGGLAPLISSALLAWSGNQPWPVAVYISVACGITIVSVWLAPETYRIDLEAKEAIASEVPTPALATEKLYIEPDAIG